MASQYCLIYTVKLVTQYNANANVEPQGWVVYWQGVEQMNGSPRKELVDSQIDQLKYFCPTWNLSFSLSALP